MTIISNNYTALQNKNIQNRQDSYLTTSKKYVRNLIYRITQCAPLLVALATIGVTFWLIPQIEASLPERSLPTTELPPVLDDVDIIPIGNNRLCRIIEHGGLGGSVIVLCDDET